MPISVLERTLVNGAIPLAAPALTCLCLPLIPALGLQLLNVGEAPGTDLALLITSPLPLLTPQTGVLVAYLEFTTPALEFAVFTALATLALPLRLGQNVGVCDFARNGNTDPGPQLSEVILC